MTDLVDQHVHEDSLIREPTMVQMKPSSLENSPQSGANNTAESINEQLENSIKPLQTSATYTEEQQQLTRASRKVVPKLHGSMSNSNKAKNLPYMSREALYSFITENAELDFSPQEIEYLDIRRRRMSVDKKPPQLEGSRDDTKSYPYKIMVVGDETASAKQNLMSLFTLPELIHKFPDLLDFINLPPCDIQTRSIEITEKDEDGNVTGKKKYDLELWLPYCTEIYDDLRPLYYPATDAFVIIFSVKDRNSFKEVQERWLPEVLSYTSSTNKRDFPIILVGNHAESRSNRALRGQLVPSSEAVELAQDNGVSKYIEIFSDNLFHVHEVFHQCVKAIQISAKKNPGITEDIWKAQRDHEDAVLREILTVPSPEAHFDIIERTFEIHEMPDVTYLITLDGSDPTRVSTKYTGPIKFKHPFPKEVKVVALARGKYSSQVETFPVPEVSAPPQAYFDTITKGFHIIRSENTTYFYTVDGSKPSEKADMYEDPGIFFDHDSAPLTAFSSKYIKVPSVVRVIACEENKFRSDVTDFKPFEVLDTPIVHYNEKDGIFTIDTLPGYVYRYTLDGTTPTYNSRPYTGPVLLPKDPSIKRIKAAAFPRVVFPSRTAEIVIENDTSFAPHVHHKNPSPQHLHGKSIKMTKASLARTYASPSRQRDFGMPSPVSGLGNGVGVVPPNGGSDVSMDGDKLSPRSNASPRRSPSRNTRASPARGVPLIRQQKTIKAALTKEEQERLVRMKAVSSPRVPSAMTPSTKNKKSFKVKTEVKEGFTGSDWNVNCKVEGTTVELYYEENVEISKLLVTTPGNGKGPGGYECFVVDGENGDIISVGEGSLQDVEGIQSIELALKAPCQKLICRFTLREGQQSCKIIDLKVVGTSSI